MFRRCSMLGKAPYEVSPLDGSFCQRAESLVHNVAEAVVAREEVIRLSVFSFLAAYGVGLDRRLRPPTLR